MADGRTRKIRFTMRTGVIEPFRQQNAQNNSDPKKIQNNSNLKKVQNISDNNSKQ